MHLQDTHLMVYLSQFFLVQINVPEKRIKNTIQCVNGGQAITEETQHKSLQNLLVSSRT